jgi:hypothetical protein
MVVMVGQCWVLGVAPVGIGAVRLSDACAQPAPVEWEVEYDGHLDSVVR